MAQLPLATEEINTQPACWRKAVDLAPGYHNLPKPGQRVGVIGCGTSWFMAMAYASLREAAGQGWTDAFTASELPLDRGYDWVVAISRSGTTTEVAKALRELRKRQPNTKTLAIVAVDQTPVTQAADHTVVLDFADEQSVVQTRFATTALAFLRTTLGEDLTQAVADCETALATELDPLWISAIQAAYLGKGWTIGLAQEAALKMREASLSFTEAYPAMDYRHGPLALAEPGRYVWMFGEAPEGLKEQVEATGAQWVSSTLDPMAHLVVAQRVAIARGQAKGLDVDHPRHLTRSIILEPEQA
ncbi:MAG: SIS domain-containing protein [Propionibacteriaceae bacterium]|jgi:fructoselysine-6-P-deglycase FrlB-like protein|nr:SIS domain-containing protein [Propionibacteriaceae bacterium]